MSRSSLICVRVEANPPPAFVFTATREQPLMVESTHVPEKLTPLLPCIARGDSTAVAECLRRYGGLVQSLARQWCGGNHDTDDIVQDIFIELWKQAARFDPALSPETAFVALIARRKLIDRYRRLRAAPTSVPLITELPGRETTSAAEQDDTMVKVRKLLAQLPDEQRQVILWAVCEGQTHQEIADRTTLPLGTVKTYVRRGLMFIRDQLSGDTIGGLR